MTKDEMTALLGSAGVEQRTLDAMVQAYEMGFEHGAKAGTLLQTVVEKAVVMAEVVNFEDSKEFWSAYDRLKGAV